MQNKKQYARYCDATHLSINKACKTDSERN